MSIRSVGASPRRRDTSTRRRGKRNLREHKTFLYLQSIEQANSGFGSRHDEDCDARPLERGVYPSLTDS